MATHRVRRALRIVALARSLGDYDTNVLGMVGEIIAEDLLKLKKAPKQSKDIDGHYFHKDNQVSVQVKALSTSRIARYGGGVKFRISADIHPQHLVVLLVFRKRPAYIMLYQGPSQEVGKTELVNGITRRGVTIHDIYKGRPSELNALIAECKRDA